MTSVCISGVNYRVRGVASDDSKYLLEEISQKITNLAEIMSAASAGTPAPQIYIGEGGGAGAFAYKSQEILLEKERNYQIEFGLSATMLMIRVDRTIIVRLNSSNGEEIRIETLESPLTITGLNKSNGIRRVYVTTEQPTTVKILAIGEV